ncbi:hypothetical protein [Methylorubrum sp. SB2]|uniref:hypothetical protein n=1 Tax=Methylorubrum subtropicum TaxID=3138812 RepID=UPI00313ED76A
MSSLTLLLPARLDGPGLFGLTKLFLDGCGDRLPTTLIFDFAVLSFVRPAGVTFLGNFIRWANSRQIDTCFVNHRRNVQAIRFLDDSLFFERFLGEKINPDACPRPTTQPLVEIANEYSHAWLRMTLMPWLTARLNMNEPSLAAFQVAASEIFNNIKDHSSIDIGSVFVQHFPQQKTVNISIADFGNGIPTTVRKVAPGITDEEAIVRAVQRGFTSQSVPGNRGAGLDFLLQTAVGTNEGSVTIYSLTSFVTFTSHSSGIVHAGASVDGFCPGTTIDINLRTDTIVQLPDERRDLEW